MMIGQERKLTQARLRVLRHKWAKEDGQRSYSVQRPSSDFIMVRPHYRRKAGKQANPLVELAFVAMLFLTALVVL